MTAHKRTKVADQEAFGKGRISMALVQKPDKGNAWWAVSLAGAYEFPLTVKANPVATILNPEFVDKQGRPWKGRTYPGGSAVFQVSRTAVPAAGAAGNRSRNAVPKIPAPVKQRGNAGTRAMKKGADKARLQRA
jgi:hypothetical protein